MQRSKRIPTWITYLVLVIAAHLAHACALERDSGTPSAPPSTAKRHT